MPRTPLFRHSDESLDTGSVVSLSSTNSEVQLLLPREEVQPLPREEVQHLLPREEDCEKALREPQPTATGAVSESSSLLTRLALLLCGIVAVATAAYVWQPGLFWPRSSTTTPTTKPTTSLTTTATAATTTTQSLFANFVPGSPYPNSSGLPSLFCFSVVTTGTTEVDLIKEQYKHVLGIFQCNHWEVYADQPMDLMAGGARAVYISGPKAVRGQVPNKYLPGTTMWLNTGVFLQAWRQVVVDPRALSSSWIVKADVDTVFLPNRLRGMLLDNPDVTSDEWPGMYVKNCQAFMSMQGPLEVFSLKAVLNFADGKENCMRRLSWMAMGEDMFMDRCMDLLGVRTVIDFRMLRDDYCDSSHFWGCFSKAVAFHSFKTPSGYNQCIRQTHHILDIDADSLAV